MIPRPVLRAWPSMLSMLAFALLGCSTYGPAKHSGQGIPSDAAEKETVVRSSSLEVHLVPLFDRESARRYLGIDPAKSRIMPALVTVMNASNEPVKVELSDSYLSAGTNKHWRTLTLKEAIDRALRSDAEVVVWSIAFGMPAWLIAADNAAATNRTLEEDYHAKYFKPTLINAGSNGQEIVFFDLPQGEKRRASAAVIRVRGLNTGKYSDVSLDVQEYALD